MFKNNKLFTIVECNEYIIKINFLSYMKEKYEIHMGFFNLYFIIINLNTS